MYSAEACPKEGAYHQRVVIVGAGIAGLACARKLLENSDSDIFSVVVLEASDQIGGRILADKTWIEGSVIDLGAEYIHGNGTELTRWIEHYRRSGIWDDVCSSVDHSSKFFIPHFTLAHGDGGGRPDAHPTSDGMYGMFFIDGQLLRYDDSSLEDLSVALEEILDPEYPSNPNTSILDALKARRHPLSPSLMQLAIAGYGNTAGSCDLSSLSLPMLQQFENHWDETEEEGDYHLPSSLGMYSIVEACYNSLKQHANFDLHLNSAVTGIKNQSSATRAACSVTSSAQNPASKTIECEHVVLTIPPNLWSSIEMDLPATKIESSKMIGMEGAIKVILCFSERCWPEYLQNIICVRKPVPEIWFRSCSPDRSPGEHSDDKSSAAKYIAVGFLVSTAAEDFATQCGLSLRSQQRDGASTDNVQKLATRLVIQQLSEALTIDANELQSVHEKTIVHDWSLRRPFVGGGYMYPKVGMRPSDLENVAAPVGCIHFAGEATHTKACCTVQAAIETGNRAADEILSSWQLT